MKFGQYARNYQQIHDRNLSVVGGHNSYFDEYKIKALKTFLSQSGLPDKAQFLDFGCGLGKAFPFFKKHFSHGTYHGLDVSEEVIEVARETHPGVSFDWFDGKKIPFEDNTLDVVFAACVFHHLNPHQHEDILQEMRRVLKPGGFLFIVEHNPLNPLTLYLVRSCEFDDDAILIPCQNLKKVVASNGYKNVQSKFVVFLPPALGRKWADSFEDWLGWLPLGGQYWVAARNL